MDIDKGQGISMDKDFKAEAPQEKDNYIEQSFNTFKSSKHEPLEVFEDLIIECFGLKQQAHTYCEDKLILSHGVSRSGSPFLCIWESLRSRLNESKDHTKCDKEFELEYLPAFYVVAIFNKSSVDDQPLISLRLITFHGKIVSELKEIQDRPLADEERLNFIKQLMDQNLRLCLGLSLPSKNGGLDIMDQTLMLNAQTFTSLYLVEQFNQEIVVRSRQCNFVLYKKDGVDRCKECTSLNKVNDVKPKRATNQGIENKMERRVIFKNITV